ncbi:tRNA dihydrouridine synthase DusB [Christensenella minuta]|uniref:tRNA dihydrouridine synthase DusB n=1 Tax=Christensenella minuta TaxID=626937 RepID=UPI0021581DF4|nr:tRNA dihydrouridine synthase DusB [Christensenella minuta]
MDEPKIYLAPMAGVTDAAMRKVCTLCGAQMTFTEMVSAKGIAYQNGRTHELLELSDAEEKAGVQLFGREPQILADTARKICDLLGERLFIIDVNMGCPVPKIVNNGEGSALMREPALAARIVSALKKAVPVPVSVKFRAGFTEKDRNAAAFAKVMEDAGADAVAVHGRTREQYYRGKADLGTIAEVKQAVKVKVIGNGDIFAAQDAVTMFRETGCDAVMVARGAQGNPFLFTQISELLRTGSVQTLPMPEERIHMCLRQARIAVRKKGEALAMRQMRGHAPHYIKGMKGAAQLRAQVVRVETYAQLEDILLSCL